MTSDWGYLLRLWSQLTGKPNAAATKRLAVCIPSNSRPAIGFTYSITQLLLHLRSDQHPLSGWDVALVVGDGSVIHDNREKLVIRACEMGSTHVLFLDDDMVFEPQTVFSLLGRDRPFVACNYPRRIAPHHFTASSADQTRLIETSDASTGLEPAGGVGFGMVLLERQVFAAIPRPWFLPTWDAVGQTYVSEDIGFCRRAIAAGYAPYVDHDASKTIGHISSRVLRYNDAELIRGPLC